MVVYAPRPVYPYEARRQRVTGSGIALLTLGSGDRCHSDAELWQQEAIQLKFQNDLSYQQIAEIMQTTANNVGVLLHTALKTLRERYAQVAGDFVPFEPKPK